MIRPGIAAFAGHARTGGIHRFVSGAHKHHALRALPQDAEGALSSISSSLPTVLTSVKVFDGSEITDAVVVSNSYWSALASKLPQLLLSQLVASIAFVAIASFAAAQGKFLIDVTSDATNNGNRKGRNKSTFRGLDEPPQPPPLDFAKLFLCICIDILGSANEAIPLVGELVDVVYAPIAALLLRQLFAGSNVVFLLEFTEEILPFTDILPLASICWVVEAFFGASRLAEVLRIGAFAPNRIDSEEIIDVESFDANLLPRSKKGDADKAKR